MLNNAGDGIRGGKARGAEYALQKQRAAVVPLARSSPDREILGRCVREVSLVSRRFASIVGIDVTAHREKFRSLSLSVSLSLSLFLALGKSSSIPGYVPLRKTEIDAGRERCRCERGEPGRQAGKFVGQRREFARVAIAELEKLQN